MIAKFFNKSSPINTLTIIILLFVVFILGSTTFATAQFSLSFFGKRVIDLGIVAITFFLVNFIIRKNDLSKENTYVVILLVCCFGMFPHATGNREFLLIHLLLLMAVRRIYSLKSIRKTKEKLFDAGFWIGIVSLINPLGLLFIILIYSGLISYKKFTPRNLFIPIVGLITPLFIYGVYLFSLDRLAEIVPVFTIDFSLTNYSALHYIIALTLLIGFLIWTIVPTTIKIMTVKMELKGSWYLLLIHLVTCFLFILPQPDKNGSELIFLFFPTAVIFTNYLQQSSENWFKEVFMYLFLAAAFFVIFL